jgi:hypothetical protein
MASARSAWTCSDTFIDATWAPMAEPDRPASTRAEKTGPSSSSIDLVTIFGMNVVAPRMSKSMNAMPVWSARTAPVKKAVIEMIGQASTPSSSRCDQKWSGSLLNVRESARLVRDENPATVSSCREIQPMYRALRNLRTTDRAAGPRGARVILGAFAHVRQ